MMANLRPALLIALVFLAYLMWVEWQRDYGAQPEVGEQAPPAQTEADIPSVDEAPSPEVRDIPDAPPRPSRTADIPVTDSDPQRALVTVATDVLKLEIDPVGGTVVAAYLLNYPVDLDLPETKVQLFGRAGEEIYVAQSGLLSRSPAPNHRAQYRAERMDYRLADGEDQLAVSLRWQGPGDIEVTKVFRLRRGEYDIEVHHRLNNGGAGEWTGSQYAQLQRTVPSDDKGSGFNNPERYSFKGIGFYSPDEKLEKIDFEDVEEDPYNRASESGWLAMIQHYFFSAWVPPGDQVANYSTQVLTVDGRRRAIARAVSPPVTVGPGGIHEFSNLLYVGPKLQDKLAGIAPGLDLTVNYGIFTVLSAPLFWLLSKIHAFVGNWGWAIVILTILIKLAFFKLTEAQFRSMARMRKLQPRIEKLKERYGDDRQAMSQAMMQMYKEEKVNPLGGCLPILVQIPIFIALYWVLIESVELRQAPFILWIDNLSRKDPYFILPALNAVFMILTQRLTPTAGMDPLQAKMMQAMPIVFSIMFAFFPAGLVLYWATNAGLSLAQQWYITRKIARD